jgi:hypothetical protein
MTDDEKKAYAERLVRLFGQQLEYYTIFELYEGGDEISDADANDVAELVGQAKVTVSWNE